MRCFVFDIVRFPKFEVRAKLLQVRNLLFTTSPFPRSLRLTPLLLRLVSIPGLSGLAPFPRFTMVVPMVLPVFLGLPLGRWGAWPTHVGVPLGVPLGVGGPMRGLPISTYHLSVSTLTRGAGVARVWPHVWVVPTVWASTTRHRRPLTSRFHSINLVLPLR